MIASLIGIFTYAVYIGETNLGLLMVILITYPLIFWIAGKLVKRIRGLQANYRQKTDVMAQIAQDAVSGILVLRSFGIEDVFRRKMHRLRWNWWRTRKSVPRSPIPLLWYES